jgi:hypothetical protein
MGNEKPPTGGQGERIAKPKDRTAALELKDRIAVLEAQVRALTSGISPEQASTDSPEVSRIPRESTVPGVRESRPGEIAAKPGPALPEAQTALAALQPCCCLLQSALRKLK